jgi:uncharacterized membrane protein
MRNYVAVVFDDTGKAYKGLHALWEMDRAGEIILHGTAVVHRDDWGEFQVDTKETHPALGTAVGVGLGALLGALAGPAGTALGATTGGMFGATTDLVRADNRDQAAIEMRLLLRAGQSAVVADVSEDWTSVIDTRMRELGGTVHRCSWSAVQDDAWWSDDGYLYPYGYYLYPHEYIPDRRLGWYD